MDKLGIKTQLADVRDFRPRSEVRGDQDEKTNLIIETLKNTGATDYLVGPASKDYIDETLFKDAGIGLEYKSYDYPPYPQIHGEFMEGLSILDLLFNTGPDAREYITSRTPDEIAVAQR